MQNPRNRAPQQLPPAFADLIDRMRIDKDPRLNPVLAAARRAGWHTATLAEQLGSNPQAAGKRIERAKLVDVDIADIAIPKPVWVVGRADDRAGPALDPDGAEDEELIRAGLSRTRPRMMMDGRRLPDEEIAELREMQPIASRVNGATPVDSQDRAVSEEFSRRLHQHVQAGFTSYYLAKEIGITPRAVNARLERHGWRPPCPSVAGTPSGQYRRRRVGELTPEQVGELTPEQLEARTRELEAKAHKREASARARQEKEDRKPDFSVLKGKPPSKSTRPRRPDPVVSTGRTSRRYDLGKLDHTGEAFGQR